MLGLPFDLSWGAVILGAIALYVVQRAWTYYRDLRTVSFLPGMTFPASHFSIPGSLLPSSKWNPGLAVAWKRRHTMYADSPVEMTRILGFLTGRPCLFTNSPEVIRQMLGNKAPWDKLQETVNTLAPLGANVFATMRDEWPRHRKAVAPGFNGRLYANVWTETIDTYYDCMTSEKWEKETEFIMTDVTAITSKFALFLIAKCGFGIDLAWNEEVGERVSGMSLAECFEITSVNTVILSFVPHWMYRLPVPALRRLYEASSSLQGIVQGIIDQRRAEGFHNESQAKDVFTLLLAANELEKGSKGALSDQELISNVFLLLLAGHETTSKSLAATLGELACHPEEQQRAYDEVMSVVKDGKNPTYEDFERLPFIQGCFQEALRMYPSVLFTTRCPIEDVVLQVPCKDGGSVPLHLARGTPVNLDFAGVGYNARVYPEPYAFKPARWLDSTTEPLLAFSYGPRVCIGRKFAVVESTAVLALLLRDYKVELVLKGGQTVEEWRAAWVDHTELKVGFGHKQFPLKFTRRSGSL
ncbi:cytochrome P450 [Calocera cornea HHB12733]|uniref:Cytochrome P450 n=1 Tax=Calocera cornea HHB12733 TaxID=1353952 RepID=A0A165EY08_9BASI|nr:cytochrome P450 [Calocera cornea HHB12733]